MGKQSESLITKPEWIKHVVQKRVKFLGVDFQQDELLCKIGEPLCFLFVLSNQSFNFHLQMATHGPYTLHILVQQ